MKKVSRKVESAALLGGNILTVAIATTPYIFYSYEIFPDFPVWENFLFTYNSGFYESVSTAFWVILGKLVPFALMLFWFVSCKHWWYRVILVPLSMYGFQLFSAINEDLKYIDKYEMYFIVPVVIGSLALSYLSRIKLQDKIQEMDELEKEVKKPSDYFFSD
ncbi:MAG: hypothetical protein NWQ19_06225 [Nonlabens sp.]|nr:hypothetical protein [Nonlabens sp.]